MDLRVRSPSDVTGAEMRGVFGDLQVSCFLQSREEEGQWGWCVVSSFASLFLSVGVLCLLVSSAIFWYVPTVKKCVFYIVFLLWSDQIGFSMFLLPRRSRIGRKFLLTFFFFFFFTNFIDISLCDDPMRRTLFFFILKKVSAPITSGEFSRGC